MNCRICGKPKKDDLFSAVTQEPVCSICKIKHIGGLKTSDDLIKRARERLGLKDGEFLNQDNGEEARKLLGKKR